MEKYKITQKVLGYLEVWKATNHLDATTGEPTHFLNGLDLTQLPLRVRNWKNQPINPIDRNNRLIAILQWLNGEDVFEFEKPHKFIVRSVEENDVGEPLYLELKKEHGLIVPSLHALMLNYGQLTVMKLLNLTVTAKK